jgi:hypothetical protein
MWLQSDAKKCDTRLTTAEDVIARRLFEYQQHLVSEIKQVTLKQQEVMMNCSLEWKEGRREELEKFCSMTEHHVDEMVNHSKNYVSLLMEKLTDDITSRYSFLQFLHNPLIAYLRSSGFFGASDLMQPAETGRYCLISL